MTGSFYTNKMYKLRRGISTSKRDGRKSPTKQFTSRQLMDITDHKSRNRFAN